MVKFLHFVSLVGYCLAMGDGVHAFDGGRVRLAGGEDRCSGRVEVLHHHSHWGTVCDHSWDLREADVVCMELGCGLAEAAPRGAAFGAGRGNIWRQHVRCLGHEYSLTQCVSVPYSDPHCTHENDAGVKCSGTPPIPTLSLLSPRTVFLVGEAVRFGCAVSPGRQLRDFRLYRHGMPTPLVTQRVDQSQVQARVELTLSDLEASHHGSYRCVYGVKGSSPSQLFSSSPSNSINITVVELQTPQHWYNTSGEAPPGSVVRGHGFNITCSAPQRLPGGSFQLRLSHSNGTERRSLPAINASSVTFSFRSAQASHQGYYYCLYRVQMGGRTFVSRESQPLPISVTDPEPVLSPMVISWLLSGLTFLVATGLITITAKILCKKENNPSELERETRACVDNTYVALSINKTVCPQPFMNS